MQGKEVKIWLFRQGLTQREFGEAVGLPPQQISMLLSRVDAVESELIRRGCPLHLLCPAVVGEILEERLQGRDDSEFLEPDNAAMTPFK